MPTAPAITASVLAMPPLLEGERATATPIRPKTIAIKANTSPQTAPVVKLKNAATIAMMDGMLKLEVWLVVVLICFVEVMCVI